MKKLLFSLLSLGLILLCMGCGNGAGDDPFVDDFDQAAWEADVTEAVSYADFTEGTWWFRKESSLNYIKTGEFVTTMDIIGSDYQREDYFNNFTYTKIITFDHNGYYCEYDDEDLEEENTMSFKISTFNRGSVDFLDTSKEEWSKRVVVTCNHAKTKFKTYTEEWAVGLDDEWGIHKSTCFFEKIK